MDTECVVIDTVRTVPVCTQNKVLVVWIVNGLLAIFTNASQR